MKIEMLPADKLEMLKLNITELKSHFSDNSNKWLTEYFKEKPFVETRFEFNDVTLTISDNPDDDYENVIKLYSSFKDLPDSIASDERLWAGLALGPFWNYCLERWGKNDWSEEGILNHIFFGANNGHRRALTRNAISRLWWIGRLTYDESNKENPYKYTKYVCLHQRFIVDFLERNISNSLNLIKPCIDAVWRFEAENPEIKINSNQMREIQKYVNILGGTYILDSLDYSFLVEKVYSKILEIV